jgi:hypothetical protein
MATVTGATMTAGQLEAQNKVIDSTDAQKLSSAINSIENSLTSALAPALSRFADTLKEHQGDIEGFARGAGEAAQFFLGHPFAGLGAVVLATVSKDLAAAGIGAAVKSLLAGLLSGAAGGSGIVGTVAGGASGAAGSIGGRVLGMTAAGAAGAAAGAAAGVSLTDRAVGQLKGEQDASVSGGLASYNALSQFRAKTRAGTLTPADIAKAEKEVEGALNRELSARDSVGVNPMGMAQTAMFAARGMLGDVREQQTREQKRAFDESLRVLVEWTQAMKAAKAVVGATVNGGDATNNPARNGPMPPRGDPRHT